MRESDDLMHLINKAADSQGWDKLASADPIFETTLEETLGIRKFLEMSKADLREQLKRAAKHNPRRFKEMRAHAAVLIAWMDSALEMVDNMLAEAKAREPVQEAPKQ